MTETRSDEAARPQSPLHGTPPVRTKSSSGETRGVVVRERPWGLALQVIARRGKVEAAAQALHAAIGVEAPTAPRHVPVADAAILWSGPGQWLVLADASRAGTVSSRIETAATGVAALIDQSDGRIQLGMSGPRTRDALAKLVGIDVDPRVFPVGAAAMTVIAHIPVHIWRAPDSEGHPVFEIVGPRSFAGSLWHHIVVAASEYGLEATPLQESAATS